MDKLTPSAKLTLDALQTGPGNVHELSERTGRSRSATDKALADLVKANLIVKVDDGGDPADGAPTRWQLADTAAPAGDTSQPETNTSSPAETDADQPDTTGPAKADSGPDAGTEAGTEAGTATDAQATDSVPPDSADNPTNEPEPAGGTDPQPDTGPEQVGEATPDGEAAKQDGDGKPDEADAPKLCRGCKAQMPKICPCCWQKTPTYCGNCRKTMPQARSGEPGEPVILSNGLPKLRPGELEALVEKVMREHPLPTFAGVTGWTGGRVAIHLPGRSTGAINNALEKLDRTGVAELIGDKPMRYQLKPTNEPASDTGGDTDNSGNTEGQATADQADATPAAQDTAAALPSAA